MTGTGRGPVRLSAAIMTHPARLAAATRLAQELPELSPQIVVDPDPGRPDSCLRNARRAWAAAAESATHHLVLQDDCLLGEDFLGSLLAAARRRPCEAISLFTEWGSDSSYAVRLAAMAGFALAPVIDHYVPTVGLMMPARTARAFAAWDRSSALQDDVCIAHFLAEAGVRAQVTVPNLIDHDSRGSTVGNDHMGARRSAYFAPWHAGPGNPADLETDIPFFHTNSGRPRAALYDPALRSWRAAPFTAFLERIGITGEQSMRIGADGEAAVAMMLDAGVRPELFRTIGGMRCVAFGIGWQAARHSRSAGPPDMSALESVPRGALRPRLTPAAIEALAGPITTLLRESAAFGIAHAESGVRV